MSDNDAVRRRLRDADPAARAELPSEERIAMRRAVVGAAAERTPRQAGRAWILFGATACAAALVIGIAWKTSGTRREPVAPRSVAQVLVASPPEVASTASAPSPSPRAAVAVRHGVRPIVPVTAARAEGTTRIQFVAPEGTRVFWFPNSPNASEVGS